MLRKELTGQRFGRYTVLGFSHKDKLGKIFWLCRCDCGNERAVYSSRLLSGETKSCGCYSKENQHNLKLKHGDSIRGKRNRLYVIWMNIKQRCLNEKATSYPRYGKKGIKICEEWKNDYEIFRTWALSHGYMNNLTIDRIDSSGNYEPSNCRWVTELEQNRNQKTNIMFEYANKRMCLSAWCEIFNLKYGTILYRIKHGKTFQEAIQAQVNSAKFEEILKGMEESK